jgi:EAL domain-containing protein (putative c-di-GMP-specific phosphodiesterase class I)
MSLVGPDSLRASPSGFFNETGTVEAPHILLVTNDQRWDLAVREAAGRDGSVVESVSAHDAIVRVARTEPRLSHVLVEPGAMNGLLDVLLDLTSDIASAGTELVLLGEPATDDAAVISAPGADLVAASLANRSARSSHGQPGLLASELRDVIDGRMIDTRYQPIVRIADRRVASMEVLARLRHPVHGMLAPDWFVARFEEAGLSTALTDFVSTRALADLNGLGLEGLDLALALNYPLRVLTHPSAAAKLDDLRASLGLAASRIHIELTESRPVDDFAALGRSLDHLRTLGYRVSIDDAGPAVPNIERLMDLPFTGMKLDKSTVRMIGAQGKARTYVLDLIGRALRRDMVIVAEGIETEETWHDVRGLGVQEAQGYFVARPLPAAAVRMWLEHWNQAAA